MGLDTSRHYTMDWDLWLRLYCGGGRFRFLDAPLAAVRVYPQTKTLSGASARYREIWDLLTQYARWRERLTSMMGFRYYDVVRRRTTPSDYLTYYLISSVKEVRRLARRPDHRRTVFGLECGTNRVQKGCEVLVPWWNTNCPIEALMLSDYDSALQVSVSGRSSRVKPSYSTPTEFAGREIKAHAFRVSLPAPQGHTMSLRLEAERPWTLYGIWFTS